jgi:hypothetical protein
VFDAGDHCDLRFTIGQEELGAHRLVLRRNPDLGLDSKDAVSQITLPEGIGLDALRQILRSHYVEVCGDEVSSAGPRAALMELRKRTPEDQLAQLEAAFGPLDASRWATLKAAVDTELFADVRLQSSGGITVQAHRFMLLSPDDGHYFAASMRWPSQQEASACTIAMPDGLSHGALLSLLRMRYGADEIDASWILETRHFAELLDWPAVRKCCEAQLESLLTQAGAVDGASLLAVVSHAEESASMPPRLKAAALAAAVRNWSQVAEAAQEEAEAADATQSLKKHRQAELRTMNRVHHRDGHVCGSLQEYLHAAADDLVYWENTLTSGAPIAAKKKLEDAWNHWHHLLFEYGHIFGAVEAEEWREKVRARRKRLQEERSRQRGQELKLPEGRTWFEASFEWQEVPGHAICPAGLEYRFDMQTGRNFARLSC